MKENERIAILGMLLGACQNGMLPHGIFTKIAKKYRVAPKTVSRLWHKCPQSRNEGMVDFKEIASKRYHRGRPVKWDRNEVNEAIQQIPVLRRQTFRDLQEEMDVPKTTLHRMCEEEDTLRRKKVYLKPKLEELHKSWRMEYCLEQEDSGFPGFFDKQYNKVHVDEKWFHRMSDGRCFILGKDEEDPYHHCKHKNYIDKVMFLCAVARPRYLPDGTYFDGKIGIWPFGHIELAKVNSKNRPAGTPEWVNDTCDADNYRSMLINNVLPAIIDKFPWSFVSDRRLGVVIQQDGAGGHIKAHDEEFAAAVEELGINVSLQTQPAQSPDLNINDLAFFPSIASLMKKKAYKDKLELIDEVKREYDNYPPDTLNRMWLTHMMVMNEILKSNGHNDYKLPHLKKCALEKQGRLPSTIEITTAHPYFRRRTRALNTTNDTVVAI